MGLFNTAAVRPFVFLPPTSSRIHLQRRHASYRRARPLPAKAGTITNEFRQQIRNSRKFTRFFYMPQSWDMGHVILLPLRRKAYWGFFRTPEKIQRLRPGLNPRTRVPVASMLTTRPSKPSIVDVYHCRVVDRHCFFFSSGLRYVLHVSHTLISLCRVFTFL